MLMRQMFQVGPRAAAQTIKAVPRKAKNADVTPKNPTHSGPTQKSNRSPPIRVPPRVRYLGSKLSIAIARFSRRPLRPSYARTERNNGRGPDHGLARYPVEAVLL